MRLHRKLVINNDDDVGDDGDGDEEEDEETLQLRLDALEARLKLKKLQQRKLRAANFTEDSGRKHNGSNHQVPSVGARSSENVQVMVSPQKRIVVEEAQSPGRVLLGIDKGLKGRNVSLRRPPSSRPNRMAEEEEEEDLFRDTRKVGPSGLKNTSHDHSVSGQPWNNGSKSFSERILDIRRQDNEKKERANRLLKKRSNGFGIQQQDLDAFKNAPVESTDQLSKENVRKGEFSREEVLSAVNKPSSGLIGKSNTVSGVRNVRRQQTPPTSRSLSSRFRSEATTELKDRHVAGQENPGASRSSHQDPDPRSSNDDPLYEEFSSIHLSKRAIPHDFLTKTFGEKHVAVIPSLLATIKSPTYDLPRRSKTTS